MLSMGRCVVDLGWDFHWTKANEHAPYAIKPDGTVVWFVVQDYVLYFDSEKERAAAAATDEEPPGMRFADEPRAAGRTATEVDPRGGEGGAPWRRRLAEVTGRAPLRA